MQTETENNIWEGSPSQWMHFPFYIGCSLLLVIYGLGLVLAFYKYIETKCIRLRITDQRVIEKRGILSVTTNQLELYRVKDIKLEQPLMLRIFGLATIVLITSDSTNPIYKIKGIENGHKLIEKIRISIDKRRDAKGVKEYDFINL